MDITLLREISTVVSFAIFVGVIGFAVHPRNRTRFEQAAQAVLDDEGETRG